MVYHQITHKWSFKHLSHNIEGLVHSLRSGPAIDEAQVPPTIEAVRTKWDQVDFKASKRYRGTIFLQRF